jgi:DNA-binding NarL/FixJ family response regulator
VVVIDDHDLLCDIIVTTLAYEGFQAASIAPHSVGAVIEECDRIQPTLALLDLDLGCAEFNGFDLIGPLIDRAVDVVILSGSQNRLLKAASLEAGAKAVISKAQPFPVMLEVVRLAARGELLTDPSTRDSLSRALREHRQSHEQRLAPFGQLSPREREVLALLVDGCSADVIAARCFVSVATVRSQIRAILTKLGVSSQLGAVAAAKRNGWSASVDVPLVRYSSTLWI